MHLSPFGILVMYCRVGVSYWLAALVHCVMCCVMCCVVLNVVLFYKRAGLLQSRSCRRGSCCEVAVKLLFVSFCFYEIMFSSREISFSCGNPLLLFSYDKPILRLRAVVRSVFCLRIIKTDEFRLEKCYHRELKLNDMSHMKFS